MERRWWTLIGVCLGTFMLLVDVTIVNVALPSIQNSLHATFSELQWVVDAYALSLAALLLTMGSLADLYGRRLVFTVGLCIFTLGSLLCAVATSPIFIILARAGQGVGGAIMFATSLALIAQAFQGHERGKAFAIWGAITGIGTALGPVLGGVITSEWSWRGIFLVNLPIGVVGIAISVLRVEESKDPRPRRPDWAGFVTFTLALCALVYGLIRAGEKSWTDPGVEACFGVAVVILVLFFAIEERGTQPMIDLGLFRVPTFTGAAIAAFAMNGSLFAMLLYIVIYFQDSLGYSAIGTGVRLLVLSLSALPSAIASGWLSGRIPVRFLIGPGLVLCAAGLYLMASLTAGSTWSHLIVGFVIGGVGSGLVNPALASTAVGVVHHREAGMASGINTTFRQVGIATGIAVFGTLFTAKFASKIISGLANTPLSSHAKKIAVAITQGNGSHAVGALAKQTRVRTLSVIHGAFASGLNEILIVSGSIAAVAGIASFVLISSRDFVPHNQPGAEDEPVAVGLG